MGFLKHYPIKKMYNHPAGRVSPPPSTDENAEAQRGEGDLPKPQRWGLDPQLTPDPVLSTLLHSPFL